MRDANGAPHSHDDASAVAGYDAALALLLGFRGDPVAAVDGVLAAHPDLVMGHNLRAALHLLGTEKAALAEAGRSLAAAEALAGRANDRERLHLAAIRAWAAGDLGGAARAWEEVLLRHPTDVLALFAAHQLDFFTGDAWNLRDRVARVLPAFGPDLPASSYLLGMLAFGLEECGDYGRAEAAGREAVERNPRDAWAIHAVAHVLEMQGRQQDGIAWLGTRTANWAEDNFFAVHNWWHLALFHLDLEDGKRVLALYDGAVRRQPSTVVLDLVDASSLLWRLRLQGIDVGARWGEVAECWAAMVDDGWYAFNDVHAAMAFVSAGRHDLAARQRATLERAAAGAGTNARMAAEIGRPVLDAVLAYDRGDDDRVLDLLLPVRFLAHRFGGSHAQRDLVHQTAIHAALRGGQPALARALARERVTLKPSSPANWRWLGRALDRCEDPAGAAEARRRADAIRVG